MCLRDEDGVNNLVKYLLFFFNFIFWVIGCILIGVGAWAYIEKNKFYHSEVESIYDILFDVSIGVIIVGCIVFIIAFAGCLGALRENICLLKFFSYILGILFLLEVVGAVLIFAFSSQGKEEVTKLFREEGIVRYRDDPDFQSIFDWFQETFKCCGVGHKGYRDWSLNPYFNCNETNYGSEKCAVPYSCCIQPNNIDTELINKMCGYGVQKLGTIDAADKVYVQGCVQAVIDAAEQNLYIVGGIALALAVPQIVGPVLGCYLVHKMKRKTQKTPRKFSLNDFKPRKTSTQVYPIINKGTISSPEEKKSFPVIKNYSWIPWMTAAFTKFAMQQKAKAPKQFKVPVINDYKKQVIGGVMHNANNLSMNKRLVLKFDVPDRKQQLNDLQRLSMNNNEVPKLYVTNLKSENKDFQHQSKNTNHEIQWDVVNLGPEINNHKHLAMNSNQIPKLYIADVRSETKECQRLCLKTDRRLEPDLPNLRPEINVHQSTLGSSVSSQRSPDVPYIEAELLPRNASKKYEKPGIPRIKTPDVPYIEAELLPRNTFEKYEKPGTPRIEAELLPKKATEINERTEAPVIPILHIPRVHKIHRDYKHSSDCLYPSILKVEDPLDLEGMIAGITRPTARGEGHSDGGVEPPADYDYDFDNASDNEFPTLHSFTPLENSSQNPAIENTTPFKFRRSPDDAWTDQRHVPHFSSRPINFGRYDEAWTDRIQHFSSTPTNDRGYDEAWTDRRPIQHFSSPPINVRGYDNAWINHIRHFRSRPINLRRYDRPMNPRNFDRMRRPWRVPESDYILPEALECGLRPPPPRYHPDMTVPKPTRPGRRGIIPVWKRPRFAPFFKRRPWRRLRRHRNPFKFI